MSSAYEPNRRLVADSASKCPLGSFLRLGRREVNRLTKSRRLDSTGQATERHRSIWKPQRNATNRKWLTGFERLDQVPVTYDAGPELKNRRRCGRYPGVTPELK